MSAMNRLIDQETGEIDFLAVAEATQLRAAREWGGPNFPPVYERQAEQFVTDRARMMRSLWLQERGLSADEPSVMVELPAWGASGDSYGRAR